MKFWNPDTSDPLKILEESALRVQVIGEYKAKDRYTDWTPVDPHIVALAERCLSAQAHVAELREALDRLRNAIQPICEMFPIRELTGDQMDEVCAAMSVGHLAKIPPTEGK